MSHKLAPIFTTPPNPVFNCFNLVSSVVFVSLSRWTSYMSLGIPVIRRKHKLLSIHRSVPLPVLTVQVRASVGACELKGRWDGGLGIINLKTSIRTGPTAFQSAILEPSNPRLKLVPVSPCRTCPPRPKLHCSPLGSSRFPIIRFWGKSCHNITRFSNSHSQRQSFRQKKTSRAVRQRHIAVKTGPHTAQTTRHSTLRYRRP
jgi:hypothetical protein